jgi:hypothetical protein
MVFVVCQSRLDSYSSTLVDSTCYQVAAFIGEHETATGTVPTLPLVYYMLLLRTYYP